MRRIQIYLEEAMDEYLQGEALRTGRSKASLIRESVALRYDVTESADDDPFENLIGSSDADPEDVDEVVYGS